jgi:hypothetical protein
VTFYPDDRCPAPTYPVPENFQPLHPAPTYPVPENFQPDALNLKIGNTNTLGKLICSCSVPSTSLEVTGVMSTINNSNLPSLTENVTAAESIVLDASDLNQPFATVDRWRFDTPAPTLPVRTLPLPCSA